MKTPHPVDCPICGRRIGEIYRDGLSLMVKAQPCTKRCQTLWRYAKGRGGWRDLPVDLRQVLLAIWMIDHEARPKS